MQFDRRKMARFVASSAAIAAVAAGAVLGGAGVASAATGTLKLCSNGNYASSVEFPDRGGLTTTLVNAGQCVTFQTGGSSAVEDIKVWGKYNTSNNRFLIADGHYQGVRQNVVVTYGTTAKGQYYASLPAISGR